MTVSTEARAYPPRPIVGVGVVVFHGANVLLIRRAKPPRAGQWSLPGGAQKLGETVEAAARREVHEEAGIDLLRCELLTVVDLVDRDETGAVRYHYTLVDFWAEADGTDAVAGSDAAEVGWFAPDALADLGLWDETLRIIRLAAARFAAVNGWADG